MSALVKGVFGGASGVKVTIDGVEYKGDLNLLSKKYSLRTVSQPSGGYGYAYGLLNDELHCFYVTRTQISGTLSYTYYLHQYKLVDDSWVQVNYYDSTVNQDLKACIGYNGKLYVVFTSKVYEYTESGGLVVSSCAYNAIWTGNLLIWNNELYSIYTSTNSTFAVLYKLVNGAWESVFSSSQEFKVYKVINAHAIDGDGIHVLGSYNPNGSSSSRYLRYHQKWDGTQITEYSTTPSDKISEGGSTSSDDGFESFTADNKLYVGSISGCPQYVWNGSNFVEQGDMVRIGTMGNYSLRGIKEIGETINRKYLKLYLYNSTNFIGIIEKEYYMKS